MYEEQVTAIGHENVRATHESTIEVTTDDWLTPAGDCIVGIEADSAPSSFDDAFVAAAQSVDATITLELEADGAVDRTRGRGDPQLTFASDRCLIARTSSSVGDRTVLVEADTAAAGLDRDFVSALQAGADLVATLRVSP